MATCISTIYRHVGLSTPFFDLVWFSLYPIASPPFAVQEELLCRICATIVASVSAIHLGFCDFAAILGGFSFYPFAASARILDGDACDFKSFGFVAAR
jgi:hypothetical protein